MILPTSMHLFAFTLISLLSWYGVDCQPPCYDTGDLELLRTDLDEAPTNRTLPFVLCPGSNFDFSTLTDGDVLGLKSNSTIICGEDGLSDDDCTFTGGTVILEPTTDTSMTSVRVQGITFSNAPAVSNRASGDIALVDCIFKDTVSVGSLASFNYEDDDQEQFKYVTLDKCQFMTNSVGEYVIFGGENTILTVISTIFEENISNEIIQTLGPQLRIEKSCIQNNTLNTNNPRVVSIFNDAGVVSDENYVISNNGLGGVGGNCEFISSYSVDITQSDSVIIQPTCIGYESTFCVSDGTSTAPPSTIDPSATDSPTDTPSASTDTTTEVPTASPTTSSPVEDDTMSPTSSPIMTTTVTTDAPTSSPTKIPTTVSPTIDSKPTYIPVTSKPVTALPVLRQTIQPTDGGGGDGGDVNAAGGASSATASTISLSTSFSTLLLSTLTALLAIAFLSL